MVFCIKCGHQMDDNDKFCFNCGAPYERTPAPPPYEEHKVVIPEPVFDVQAAGLDVEIPVSIPVERTVYLSEEQMVQEDTEEVTGELNPPVKKTTYASLTYMEDGKEKEFIMTENILCIGRDPESCEVVLQFDRFIGRNHALIFYKNDKFFVVDLSSKNGTFVGGERITGLRKLENETLLKFANTEAKFKAVV